MSWTDTFPVMSAEMVDEFEALATPGEKAELEEWYGVKEIFNAQDKPHLVSFSVFWKPGSTANKAYPTPTREILMTAGKLGLDLPFEPWSHHIQPVLDTVPALLSKFDDVTARVYLAADLDFLVPDFLEAGCEVYLMRHSSLAHAPGAAWRLLALGEKDRLVTMIDSDGIRDVALDLKRTRTMQKTGLGCWREPICIDYDNHGNVSYSAFKGCHLGLVGGWPMEKLLHAFTWHSIRGTVSTIIELPGCSPRPIGSGHWPNPGFEEWFLSVVMYPRLAASGMLTFVPGGTRSSLLLMDIEYVTWANPKSELVIFPSGSSCCGPGPMNLETVSAEAQEDEANASPPQILEGAV